MTAPTLVWSDMHTQGSAAPSFPATPTGDPTIGDLGVIIVLSANNQLAATVAYDGGGSAGWTFVRNVDGGGNTRASLFWKELTADDFNFPGQVTEVLKTLTFSDWSAVASNHIISSVYRHADGGWELVDDDEYVANPGAGDYTAATLTDPSRAGVAVFGISFATASGSMQVKWDGGAAEDPQWEPSTSRQAEYKLYDSSDSGVSIVLTAGGGTNKAFVAGVWQVGITQRTIADDFGLTDSSDQTSTFQRTITDDIGLTDEAVPSNPSEPQTYERDIFDSFGLTDVVPRTLEVTLTDDLGLLDDGAYSHGQPETINLFDAVTAANIFRRTISDSFGLGDASSAEHNGTHHRIISSGFSLTDTIDVNQFVAVTQFGPTPLRAVPVNNGATTVTVYNE